MAGWVTRLFGAAIIAGAVLLSRASWAQESFNGFPPGFGGLYFGESTKSAQRKCENWNEKKRGAVSVSRCNVEGHAFRLGFKKGKLDSFEWDISAATYAFCAKEILRQRGVKARTEDKDGNELWVMMFYDDAGAETGLVICENAASGPTIYFSSDV